MQIWKSENFRIFRNLNSHKLLYISNPSFRYPKKTIKIYQNLLLSIIVVAAVWAAARFPIGEDGAADDKVFELTLKNKN